MKISNLTKKTFLACTMWLGLIVAHAAIKTVDYSAKKTFETQKWEVLDITFRQNVKSKQPFAEQFSALFTTNAGDTMVVPGFYNGHNEWIIRFSASKTGVWNFTTKGIKTLANKSGKVTVTPNTNAEKHGAVVIPANDSKHFAYEDGTPYFLLAFECDWLFALDYHNETDLPKSKHLLNLLKQNGINQIVMNVYTHDVSWKKDDLLKSHPEHEFGGSKDIFPFLGNNDKPDFSALNPGFFQKMDRTIALLADLNIDSHLMIYVWNKLVKWPDMYSDADNMYFDYVVKRYQAFPNVMFDISKEALFYGRADEKYILDRISRLRAQNHYNRLLSVHDFGFCKRNPDKVDFISTQDWSWDIYNQMSTATTMFKNKPVFNIEHGGYEESPYVTFTGSYTNAEVCLRRNYACLFAGTYSTYYWQGAAWNVIIYNPFEQPADFIKPKFEYYKHLADFFNKHPYANYKPAPYKNSNGYALIDNNGNTLIYANKDNYAVSLNWLKQVEGKTITLQWFNTLTGEYGNETTWQKGAEQKSPWSLRADAILIVTYK